MKRKSIIMCGMAAVAVQCVMAHEPADSITAGLQLEEVTVKASKVIRKADMDVFYPSRSAIDGSKDGMQLLNNMMIPSLSVNEVLGTVTSSGLTVQVRINGREATVEQVRDLVPETIRRVEWMDNPGLRYSGANSVLNFIVSNPTSGGSLMTQAPPALNCAWGNYNASLKFNSRRSQWGVSARYKLTNKVKSHREYSEIFTMSDGSEVRRTETPVGGHFDDSFGGLQIDYSYIKPDTTVLWVAVHGYRQWPRGQSFDGIMESSGSADRILLHDYSRKTGFTPSFAAYLEQHFAHNQLIAVDANISLYNGNTLRDYTEREVDTQSYVTDVKTAIKDRNYAYGIEADYIRKWDNARFTAGVSYSAQRNRSTYRNLGGEVFHQRQDKVYFFGEYLRRINKVTLTAGIGAQYTSILFKETGQGSRSWNVRPQFSAAYRLSDTSQFRLGFSSWQTTPSLAETNVTPQQVDGFQWNVGNPDLKTSTSYMLSLRYNFNFPRVMGTLGVKALSSPDAITPYLYWEGGRLITSYENSRGLQRLAFELSPQIEVVPEWLTLNGTVQYKAERMRGTGYRLYNHGWSGDVTAMLRHWGFTLTAQYQKEQTSLWGETLTWGETLSILALSYDWRNWEFTAGVLCPFSDYDRGSKLLNRYNTNVTHMRLDMSPMPFLQIRYNVQWGRQKRGVDKLVNSDAEVQSSKAAGR